MAELGDALARIDPRRRRIVVGVTVPARGYAAPLAAAAHVLRRNQLDPMEPSDAELHFEVLRAQPVDTPIKLIQGGRVHDGRLLGVEEREGIELLMISTRGMKRYLPKAVALSVSVADNTKVGTELRARRITVPPLLGAFLSDKEAAAFMTQTRLDCVIAGTLTQTVADLGDRTFTTDSGTRTPGSLQELARAAGAPGTASASRSALVAGGASEEELPDMTPHLVVFDGGRAYVRLSHAWPASHHLVVIDRSLASAEPAAEAPQSRVFRAGRRCGDRVGGVPAIDGDHRVRGGQLVNLAEIDELHKVAGEWTGERRLIENADLEAFSQIVGRFCGALGETAEEGYWGPVVRLLKRARWDAATSPLPLGAPSTGIADACATACHGCVAERRRAGARHCR